MRPARRGRADFAVGGGRNGCPSRAKSNTAHASSPNYITRARMSTHLLGGVKDRCAAASRGSAVRAVAMRAGTSSGSRAALDQARAPPGCGRRRAIPAVRSPPAPGWPASTIATRPGRRDLLMAQQVEQANAKTATTSSTHRNRNRPADLATSMAVRSTGPAGGGRSHLLAGQPPLDAQYMANSRSPSVPAVKARASIVAVQAEMEDGQGDERANSTIAAEQPPGAHPGAEPQQGPPWRSSCVELPTARAELLGLENTGRLSLSAVTMPAWPVAVLAWVVGGQHSRGHRAGG